MTEESVKYDHGGKRKGSGRKSVWASNPSRNGTKAIRVPIAIAGDLMKIAHMIDEGKLDPGRLKIQQNIPSSLLGEDKIKEVDRLTNEALKLRANAGGKIKEKIREARKVLGLDC